ATLDSLSNNCHFRSVSKIHRGSYGGLDTARYTSILAELEHASGLSSEQFQRRHAEVQALVDRYYVEGRYDAIFCGKWYRNFVRVTAATAGGGRHTGINEINRRITECLLTTISFDGTWSDHLRKPLVQLARRLKVRATA